MSRILYVQYTNPAGYPPLEHSSRILADSGWHVMFLGTGAMGAGALRFRPHRNIRIRQRRFCKAGWRQKVHYAAFCVWVLGWTIAWRPQWIYASDPLACPVSLFLSWLPCVRVIYHEHDSPTTEDMTSWFGKFILWTRRKLAREADLCVSPNDQRLERLCKVARRIGNVRCVWNCPRLDEIPAPKPDRSDGTLFIYYHGNIGPAYVPLALVDAMALSRPNIRLRVIGYETVGTSGYTDCLKAKASSLGIADRVEILPAQPRYRLFEFCRRGDIGLSLLPVSNGNVNETHMLGASNKAFDYMACGLPVLVSDLPDWQKACVEPGYGLACDPEDSDSIAKVLEWCSEHRTELRRMGERARHRILHDWNYEAQFQPIAEILNR